MTPTWYDVLGVDPDATTEEIRAAWKSGIADLDPGDRRFRSLNDAAEVLLDADRRAAYDATLEPAEPAEPAPEPQLEDPTGPEPADPPPVPDRAEVRPSGRGVPAWVLAVLAALTVLMLVAVAYLLRQPSDDSLADATSDAQGAAERAAVTILSYDYRTLDEDQKAAGALMTTGYRKKYDALFEQIKANAPDVKPVVTAQIVASGIVRSGEDRVQVLVFVNRPTTRADGDEEVYRDQVVMTMVEDGGDWLVDNLDTNQLAG